MKKNLEVSFLRNVIEFISKLIPSFNFYMFLYRVFRNHLTKRDLEVHIKDCEWVKGTVKEFCKDELSEGEFKKVYHDNMDKQIKLMHKLLSNKFSSF